MAGNILREQIDTRKVNRVRMGVTAGLDSRGLLGIALDVLSSNQIVAYTSGQPGNRDRKLAPYFTEKVLKEHHILDSQSGVYDIGSIVNEFKRHPPEKTWTLLGLPGETNTTIKGFGNLATINGFLGDAISGKQLHGKIHKNWE